MWEEWLDAYIAVSSCVFPSVQRLRQATADAQLAVNKRAEAVIEQEKSAKYEQFFMR